MNLFTSCCDFKIVPKLTEMCSTMLLATKKIDTETENEDEDAKSQIIYKLYISDRRCSEF